MRDDERNEEEPTTMDDDAGDEVEDSEESALAVRVEDPEVAIDSLPVETLEKYLYRFTHGGTEVVDVTADGINHIARRAGVGIEDVEIVEDTDIHVIAKACAIDSAGNRHFGVVREQKTNPRGYPALHALENAVAKAQRNAKRGLLPMTVIKDKIRGAVEGEETWS